MFLSRCGAGVPGKNECVAPRPRRFHYERAYRASTFEITNLNAQKTKGPLTYRVFCALKFVISNVADGCLATTNASGAQPPERFGKKEKAARLAFSMRF